MADQPQTLMPSAHPARRRSSRAALPLVLLVATATACADSAVAPTGARPTLAAASADGCGAAAPIALKPGEAVAVSDSVLCVGGETAGAEYVLVPVNGNANARRSSIVTFTASGVVAPEAPPVAAGDAAADVLRSAGPANGPGAFAAALEARRLAAGRALVRPRIAAARRWHAARERRRAALRAMGARDGEPLALGQVLQLNTNTDAACDEASRVPARVVALGKSAVVVADEANPPGGFTDEDYAQIAAVFDSIIDPVDRTNFGDPSDLDENGRVILFFTRAVNALTPPNSRTYVGGFFWVRDLLPREPEPDLPEDWVCEGSNAGEMFYLLVPDPAGDVNGNRFEKTFVESATLGTVGHEFQHLINASRRIYIIPELVDLEEVWLDEGLAHMAEELIFYARAGLSPRANVDAPGLRGAPAALDVFNQDVIGNFWNFERYLASPSSNSPYSDNDRLETRGATWSFLRFAADHRGGTESETWYRLVNDGPTGLDNVRNVFGADVTTLFRDWSTSLVADDLAGADARYQQQSWNFPSVHGVVDETSPYPLRTISLADGVVSTVRVTGGGAAFLRFGVAAGTTAAVQWEPLPTGLTLTLVRTR